MKKTKKNTQTTKRTTTVVVEKKSANPSEAATGAGKTAPRERGAKGTGDKSKRKKLGVLGAAAKVLEESGQAMNCVDMVKAMLEKGYWQTGGKTPAATLYAALIRAIAAAVQKAEKSRFRKVERGKFALNT